MTNTRLERLKNLMTQRGIDAMALVPGANLFYLTGLQMHLSERVTLAFITRGADGYLLLPALEVSRAESRLRAPLKLFPWSDSEGSSAAWKQLALVADGNLQNVAVEYETMRVLELTQLQTFALGVKLSNAGEILSELRMTKDVEELDAMRRAARVIDASVEDILRAIAPGVTEKDLAAKWQLSMHDHGASTIPDEPIVASGPNSASPHTTASDRAIERGDFVILDGWCQVDGYYSDITRTIAVGSASDELLRIYDVTLRANEAGRKRVAPSVPCEEVDRAARGVISAGGYGQNFLHRTGHGLGLEVHEPPFMVEGYTLPLQPGMTFTVEPGIYLAGQGGVRIEDDVVVTQDSGESFTNFTRELLVV